MLQWQLTDKCEAFRASTFEPTVRYAVSESTTWEPDRTYDCPRGYHWATTAEGYDLFPEVGPGGTFYEQVRYEMR